MLFAIIGQALAPTKERVERRLNWQYPPGVRAIGEYWALGSDPALIAIVEGEYEALMPAIAEWDDAFEFSIIPLIAAERGMQLAKEMMAGRPRPS
jgi:hypothetical protein